MAVFPDSRSASGRFLMEVRFGRGGGVGFGFRNDRRRTRRRENAGRLGQSFGNVLSRQVHADDDFARFNRLHVVFWNSLMIPIGDDEIAESTGNRSTADEDQGPRKQARAAG